MKLQKMLALAAAAALTLSLVSCGGEPAKKIETLDDLAGCKIGVQLGTTGDIYIDGDIADGKIAGATLERYNKGFEAVQALKQGKIDAVVIDDQPAKVFVKENKELKTLDSSYIVEDYAIAVSKENSALKDEMNAAIQALKEDGTLQKILDFYIGGVEGAKPYESPEGITYDGKLVMATNAEFPPYEYHESDANGNDVIMGVDADFAKAICDKMGKELQIEDMAFDSIITAVQGGKADFGAAGMTVTEDRQKSIDFTESYCTGVQVVIVKK